MFGVNNPQSLLRPWRSLTQFSEELYAMLVSRAPVEREGPVTIRVKPGQTALRLERIGDDQPPPAAPPRRAAAPPPTPPRPAPLGVTPPWSSVRPAPAVEPDVTRRPSPPTAAVEGLTVPVGPPAPLRRPANTPRPPAPPRGPVEVPPLLDIQGPALFGGAPVKFEHPPQIWDSKKHRYYTPPAFKLPDDDNLNPIPPGGGSTTFIGQVAGDGSSPVQVQLYPDGPDNPAGDTVAVTIQGLDPNEKFKAGDWIYGIFLFSDAEGNDTYYAQVPTWRA